MRASESISVLRRMPKVRQTAALVTPPSSAAITAPSFSALTATGRPPRRPRRRGAASPACTRSWISARSNCASAPKMWNSNSPCGVVVSICSVRDRNATQRSFRSVTVVSRCGRDRPSRSNFQTTRQSPARIKASALPRPARSPRLPLARSSNRCRSSTGCEQCVALQVQHLAVALGRDAHVAHQHVRKAPNSAIPYSAPFRQGLSCRFSGSKLPESAPSDGRSENR